VYRACQDLPRVMSGTGIAIVTTPKGVMTAQQARREHVGGEVLCYVW
jgi:small subunit ribosomal protein S8